MSRAQERLDEGRVIVADGGTGALVTAAVPRLRCPEEANLKAPEAVVGVHLGFIRAGAELLEANTFGANRRKLSAQLLDDRLEEIVEAGVRLAREARDVSGQPVLVAGSIGPLGDLAGSHGAEDADEVFREHARILEGRGVDLFMVETFFELDELVAAIEAVRSVSSLPIVAQLTFDEDAETLAGVRGAEAVVRLRNLGVAAVGANCGLGPQAALAALADMAAEADGIPLTAQPNVGLPSRRGGALVYPNATADYFAEFAAQARTSVHGSSADAAAQPRPRSPRFFLPFRRAQAARALAAVEREVPVVGCSTEREDEAPAEARSGGVGRLRRARPSEGNEHGRAAGRGRAPQGVGPRGRDRPERQPDGARAALRAHGRGRDRGEGRARDDPARHASGRVHHGPPVAAPRGARGRDPQRPRGHGDPPHVGDYPGSSGVYEVDAIGLASLLSHLNRGEDYSGKAIDSPTSFYTGVAVNPSAADLDSELERFRAKVDAGARFAMTQALFDIGYLDRLLGALGGESPVPVLVGIWPLTSFELAFRLHNEVPGITIPEAVQEQLASAGPDARRVGLRARPRADRGVEEPGGRHLRHSALQGADGGPRPSRRLVESIPCPSSRPCA